MQIYRLNLEPSSYLFYKEENELEKNLKEWDSYFEKGKLKKGRRFR